MHALILEHYRTFSLFTNPGAYRSLLRDHLPDDIRRLGFLVRKQLIHRSVWQQGNTGTNADLKYGDMTKIPWYRQPEDETLPTAAAMLAELYRRDPRGIVVDRAEEHALLLTCRGVAILTASILKAKGHPARVRSGFAPYLHPSVSEDHWVNQYWEEQQQRWITVDVDGSLEQRDFDPYDLPDGRFDFAADAWLKVREGSVDLASFLSAAANGLTGLAWELFYDFHCLMNSEILYAHNAALVYEGVERLSEEELQHIDRLARLMQHPDEHFDALYQLWESEKRFRLLG